MENEIKVGEYCRSDLGSIGKVTRIEDNTTTKFYYEDKELITIDKRVIKHSSNLIDLIEVGDYVNGYPVRRILNFNNKLCNFDLNKMEWIPLDEIDIWYEVVTKEMMESISYKVTKM